MDNKARVADWVANQLLAVDAVLPENDADEIEPHIQLINSRNAPNTPPESIFTVSIQRQKRKLDAIMALTTRPESPPKRKRRNSIESSATVHSIQSSTTSLIDRRPELSVGSSSVARRSTSPVKRVREYRNHLHTADPPIKFVPLNNSSLPPDTRQLIRDLALSSRKGFVPKSLKDYVAFTDWPMFDDAIFFEEDEHNLNSTSLLSKISRIVKYSDTLQRSSADEAAWILLVLQPLLSLPLIDPNEEPAATLFSVQTESVNPDFLSHMPFDASRVDLKADYAFVLSDVHLQWAELYERLRAAGHHQLSHTTDSYAQKLLMFSGIEIKNASGDASQAETQLGVWLAASVRHKLRLSEQAQRVLSSQSTKPNATDDRVIERTHAELGVTIIGPEHRFFVAYWDETTKSTYCSMFCEGNTRDIPETFRLAKIYKLILKHFTTGAFGKWIIDDILRTLADP